MKIRISINFIHLRSKLTSKICQKVGSLNGKTKTVSCAHFAPFFSKYRSIYWKKINAYRLFIVKIRVPTNFMCRTNKTIFELRLYTEMYTRKKSNRNFPLSRKKKIDLDYLLWLEHYKKIKRLCNNSNGLVLASRNLVDTAKSNSFLSKLLTIIFNC